jgi:hypothetical protein
MRAWTRNEAVVVAFNETASTVRVKDVKLDGSWKSMLA